MLNSVTAIIAAAGIGSRVGLNIPKALIEVGGRAIILRQIAALRDAGIESIIVVAGYRASDVVRTVTRFDRNVVVAMNHRFASTGTASSLRLGARFAAGSVIIIDGDVLFEAPDIAELTKVKPTLAVVRTSSDEPVYAEIDGEYVHNLTQEHSGMSAFEWIGIAHIDADEVMSWGDGHVFPELNKSLPARSVLVDAVEIDYPDDIENAEVWLTRTLTKPSGER